MDTPNINNISTMNVEKYRVSMEVFGNLFGKELYSVQVKNADPKYNEKRNQGLPVPLKPIKLYVVVRHNIIGVNADIDASGNPVVILKDQKGNDIRCQITNPEFKEVSVATVKEAVDAFENKRGPIFFTDCSKLTKEVIALNVGQRNNANDLAKEMAGQATMISEAIERMQEQERRYYESLNRVDRVEVTADITVTA